MHRPAASSSPSSSASSKTPSQTSAPTDIAAQGALAARLQHLGHLTTILSEEKHYLRALLDSTGDAIVAFNCHGAFVLCNRRFESLFGVASADIMGHDEHWLRNLLRDRLQAPASFFDVQPEPPTRSEEVLRLPMQSSAERLVLHWYSGYIHDEAGEAVGRIAVVRDFTHEAEVDRMKTDFISIVSHELRTPMTSIRGYVDLILDGDTGPISDLQRQFLMTVQRNTLRLTAMVNDMLDISRIEAGHIDFDIRPSALAPLLEQAVREAAPQAEAKGLTVKLNYQPAAAEAPSLQVKADQDRLQQVLTNLLSNAIKYTPAPPASPGRIEIELDIDPAAETARVAIIDSGIGIAPEDQLRLFEKFFRANNAQAREVDGSGLGLAITRSLVEGMGGRLQVQSELGSGSTFAFYLPLAKGAVSNSQEQD